MNIKIIALAATLALASHASITAQLQALPATCAGFPSHLFGGTPAGPALIGNNFAVHWATPAWICSAPPLSLQVLLLGQHQLAVFDFGGPCRTGICSVVDVLPAVILPPNSPPGSSSGWVFRIPVNPAFRGVALDMQVVAPTCVTFLPGVNCVGTGRPYRAIIQ